MMRIDVDYTRLREYAQNIGLIGKFRLKDYAGILWGESCKGDTERAESEFFAEAFHIVYYDIPALCAATENMLYAIANYYEEQEERVAVVFDASRLLQVMGDSKKID